MYFCSCLLLLTRLELGLQIIDLTKFSISSLIYEKMMQKHQKDAKI
jgi:hypothetical protein